MLGQRPEFGGRSKMNLGEGWMNIQLNVFFGYKFDTRSPWLCRLITVPGYNEINQLTPTPILAQSHSGWASWAVHSYAIQALVMFLLPPVPVHHFQILEH
jgi:hypothetical protein